MTQQLAFECFPPVPALGAHPAPDGSRGCGLREDHGTPGPAGNVRTGREQDAPRGLGIPHYIESKKPDGAGLPGQSVESAKATTPTAQPSCGRGRRDTSRDAYDTIKADGKLGKQQQQVFEHLTRNSYRDYTRNELAAALRLPLSSICGRAKELLDLKVLAEGERRTCSITAKSAYPLRVA